MTIKQTFILNISISLAIVVCMLMFKKLFYNGTAESKRIANEYFETYQKRTDFNKFLSFYSEDIILEDIINGDRIVGKEEFSKFFDWSNPNLERLTNEAMFVEELVIEKDKIVAKGYFTKFKWGSNTYGPMQFTTFLYLNEDEKIMKHIDWINYPNNLVDYNKRKDSNNWINTGN